MWPPLMMPSPSTTTAAAAAAAADDDDDDDDDDLSNCLGADDPHGLYICSILWQVVAGGAENLNELQREAQTRRHRQEMDAMRDEHAAARESWVRQARPPVF